MFELQEPQIKNIACIHALAQGYNQNGENHVSSSNHYSKEINSPLQLKNRGSSGSSTHGGVTSSLLEVPGTWKICVITSFHIN